MGTLLTLLVVGAVILLALRAMKGAADAHPKFEALDMSARPDASAENFYNKHYASIGAHRDSILRLLAHISERSGIPAGKLDPADDLGKIAAAGGLNRAMFVADLVTNFPEAEQDIMGKMAAGQFLLLHHAITLVANANLLKERAGKST